MKKGSVIFPVLLALAAADTIAAVLMVGATIAFLLVLLPLAYFLFRNRIQKPLLALVQYAHRFHEGSDDAVPASGGRMVRMLSEALQRMTDAIRQRERNLEELAAFNESDPNLMMKGARDGRIVYANRSVGRKLHDLGLPPQHYELLLPDDAEQIAAAALASKRRHRGGGGGGLQPREQSRVPLPLSRGRPRRSSRRRRVRAELAFPVQVEGEDGEQGRVGGGAGGPPPGD